jgi:hypothetical protein
MVSRAWSRMDRIKKRDMWKELNLISEGTNDGREKWLTQLIRMGSLRFPKICNSLQTEIPWRNGKFIRKLVMNSASVSSGAGRKRTAGHVV